MKNKLYQLRSSGSLPRDHRYKNILANEYRLIKLSYPHIDEFQGKVAECVQAYSRNEEKKLRIIEIGCGDGLTTGTLLSSCNDIDLIAVDIEPEMIKLAEKNLAEWRDRRTFELIISDALTYLYSEPDCSFDIVVSAWTLHNFNKSYRLSVLNSIYRVLKPNGLLVNGDKYARNDVTHHESLIIQMKRFFDAYLPIAQYEFLRDFVIHNLEDESPERIMRENEFIQDLSAIGFINITNVYRELMEAVYIASKPG